MMPAAAQEPSPLILGRYRVVQQLARGGMGVVYLGRVEGTAGFAKPVVIKRMLVSFDDSQTEMAVRFVREAKILSNLAHRGIVGVVDFGQDEGGYAMVLDYVHGFDLGRWLNYVAKCGRTIDWQQATVIILCVLDALHYAHTLKRSDGGRAQVIHRDISPGNILIDISGAVRLADFGVARMVGYGDDHYTRAGVVPGKLSYMAPELLEGVGASPASDVYAIALVFYQLLTGKNPFRGEGQVRTLALVAMGQAPPVREARPDVPAELSAVVGLALARSPQDRPESAKAFAESLRALLQSEESAVHATLRDQIQVDYQTLPGALGLTSLSEREQAWRSPGELPAAPSSPRLRPGGAQEPPERSAAGPATPTTAPLGARKEARMAAPASGEDKAVWERAPARMATGFPIGTERPSPGLRRSPPSVPQEGLTLASMPVAPSASPDTRRGRRGPLFWVGGVAGGGVLLALVVVASGALSSGASSPAFVLLERGPSLGSPGAAAGPSPSSQPSAEGLPALPPAVAPEPVEPQKASSAKRVQRREATKTNKAASLSERLSRGLARRQAELTRCFERNPSQVKDLSVSFTVNSAGKVIAAKLRPASVEPTPLGRCVLGIARSTRFVRPGRQLEFTIPLVLTAASSP